MQKSEGESHSVVSNSLQPHGLSPWNSPGQNTGVGILSLLQGIFPTQGSNPGLPHCRQILCQLSHKWSEMKSLSRVWLFATRWTVAHQAPPSTGFSRQEYCHKGSPRILEWVAYSFSSGSSWPRNQTRVFCIVGRLFTNWAMRETHEFL